MDGMNMLPSIAGLNNLNLVANKYLQVGDMVLNYKYGETPVLVMNPEVYSRLEVYTDPDRMTERCILGTEKKIRRKQLRRLRKCNRKHRERMTKILSRQVRVFAFNSGINEHPYEVYVPIDPKVLQKEKSVGAYNRLIKTEYYGIISISGSQIINSNFP